jgi:hypothetical protein
MLIEKDFKMAPRVEVQEVQNKLQSGSDLLLVCAYDDDAKFRQYHLENAISLQDFKAMEPSLSKNREIVFYCD